MKKLLFFILGIVLALVALIGVCAINPGLSDKLGELVNRSQGIEMSANISDSLDSQLDTSVNKSVMDNPIDEDFADVEEVDNISKVNPVPGGTTPAVEMNVPVELSRLSGMEAPVASFELFDDDSVSKDRRDVLEVGYTGEEYDFDPLFYPYYALLDEKEQAVYRQIYANTLELYPKFKTVESITEDEFSDIYLSVLFDHPELFWLDNNYGGQKNRKGNITEIYLQFNKTADNIDEEIAIFEAEANSIIAVARNYSDVYEMEKYVHDELASRITYDAKAELNQNAYGALVYDETVCAGYARSFQYIMQELGIPCYMCVGYAGESHAWDIIVLDGEYYNVDVTWDDTEVMTYDYFNKTDEDYSKDHMRNSLSVYLPECTGVKYGNLESNPVNTNLRTVEDTDIDEDLIFYDIDSYYEFLRDEMVNLGKGKHKIECVVVGSDILQTISDDLQNNKYKKAYMRKVLKELDAKKGSIDISGEILQDDSYLLIHTVVIK